MQHNKMKAILMIVGILIVFFAGSMLWQEARAEVKAINDKAQCPGQYGTPCSPEYLAKLANDSTFYEVDK